MIPVIKKEMTDEEYTKAGRLVKDLFNLIFGNKIEPSAEIVPEATLIRLEPGEQPPWLTKAYEFDGLNEIDDREELEAFLGVNPDGEDGGVAWCAYFINAVMKACGIKGTGSGAAISFSQGWGTPCECIDGAIAVWEGHVGIVVGDGVFGGNQGNMVRLNKNRAWFDKNRRFIGYFWPPGYAIPGERIAA